MLCTEDSIIRGRMDTPSKWSHQNTTIVQLKDICNHICNKWTKIFCKCEDSGSWGAPSLQSVGCVHLCCNKLLRASFLRRMEKQDTNKLRTGDGYGEARFLFNIKGCSLFSSILPSQVPRPDPCELGNLTKYFPLTSQSEHREREHWAPGGRGRPSLSGMCWQDNEHTEHKH